MKIIKNHERSLNWLKFTPVAILILTFVALAIMAQTGFKFGF